MGWNSWLQHVIILNLENMSVHSKPWGKWKRSGERGCICFIFCLAGLVVLQRNPPHLELKFWKVSLTFHMYSVPRHESSQKTCRSKMLSLLCKYEPNTHQVRKKKEEEDFSGSVQATQSKVPIWMLATWQSISLRVNWYFRAALKSSIVPYIYRAPMDAPLHLILNYETQVQLLWMPVGAPSQVLTGDGMVTLPMCEPTTRTTCLVGPCPLWKDLVKNSTWKCLGSVLLPEPEPKIYWSCFTCSRESKNWPLQEHLSSPSINSLECLAFFRYPTMIIQVVLLLFPPILH